MQMRRAERAGTVALWAILLLGAGKAVPVAAGADGKPDEVPPSRTVTLAPDENLDDRRLQRRIQKYREKYPEAAERRLEAFIESYWDPSKGMRVQVKRVTPLDEKGRPHGPQRIYRKWFGPARTTHYQHGTKHGPEKFWRESENGRYVHKIVSWKNGKIDGPRKMFHRNGELMTITHYEGGQETGVSKTFDNQGRLERTVHYKNGKKHGLRKDLWPETGEPRRLVRYKNGEVNGTVKEFYKNGNLKREVPFKDGAMHGVEKQYKPDGELRTKRYWLDGEMVPRQEYERAAGNG